MGRNSIDDLVVALEGRSVIAIFAVPWPLSVFHERSSRLRLGRKTLYTLHYFRDPDRPHPKKDPGIQGAWNSAQNFWHREFRRRAKARHKARMIIRMDD